MARKNHRVYVDTNNEVQDPHSEDQKNEVESSSANERVEEEEKKEEKIRHRDRRGQTKSSGRTNGKKSRGGNRNGKDPASRICHNKVSRQFRGSVR